MRQRKALGLEDLALSYQGGRGDFVHPTERKPSSMPKKREGVRNTEWGHGASGCWDTDTEPTTAQRRKSVEQGHGTGNGTEASRGPGNRHSSPGAHRVGPEVDRSDVDALPPHSLGGPPSEWVGLGSRRRFRFLFTVNCSLQASAGGLSGFPGLSEAPTRLALLPPRRGPGARPATTPTASRDSVPARTARVSGPGPTSNRARPWPARSPPLPAGVSASPEPPSRAWGQRCCSSPTGCCSGWRCLE